MLSKVFPGWYLLFLLLGSSCFLSKADRLNLRDEIERKQEEIENISGKVSDFLEDCEIHNQPRIFGLEMMDRSIREVCTSENGVECLNDIIFYVKNMPHFENLFCNLSCQSEANETLVALWDFQSDFNDTVATCNGSLLIQEENPLNVTCSQCSSNELFWNGLFVWTDYLSTMLNSLDNDQFSSLQSNCRREHTRRRKEAAKRAREEKRLKQKERKKKKARQEREKRKQPNQKKGRNNGKQQKGKKNQKKKESARATRES